MSSDRRILLFGGGGQLGLELQAASLARDVGLVAPPLEEANLTDRDAVARLVAGGRWTAVVNAAAWTAVDAAEDNVAAAFAVNAIGPAILAEETRRHGIPLIQVSTDYVFDGAKPAPYDEDDATGPLGVYGASKRAGEDAVRLSNPRHLIVRTAWLFGRHGGNFVKTMLRLAGERDTIRVVDDQYGTPTAAADLAGALAVMMSRPDLPELSGTYHFANRGETSWRGLAEKTLALSAASGGPSAEIVPIATAEYPTRARRPANSRLATDRVERDFGIVPRPWEEALADTLRAILPPAAAGS